MSQILKNTLRLFFSEGISRAVLIFYPIIVARYLGTEGFGKYSFALSFVTLFTIISDLGLSALTTREVARYKNDSSRYFQNIMVIKSLLSFVTLFCIIMILFLLNKPSDVHLIVYIASINVVIISFNEFFRALFRAHEQMQYEAFFKIVHNTLLLSLGLLIVILRLEIYYFFVAAIISSLVEFVAELIILFKKNIATFNIKINIHFWKILVIRSWPFGLGVVFSTLFFYVDTVILSIMIGDVSVGIYSAAYKLILASYSLAMIVSVTTLPQMSISFKKNKGRLVGLYKKTLRYMSGGAILLFLACFSLSHFIIKFIYGEEFKESVLIFQILSLSILFKYISVILGNVLTSMDQQKKRMTILGFCTLFNIISNIVLINYFDYIGAAITTVLSEFLLLLFYFIYSQRYLNNIKCRKI